ncbi:Predicted RNA binding protein YcfA, dsRBD-like fold, HicA-like mRNA interferase family [Lactobacillus bombicola]|uniref:Predicted RNA binding protein YcfA, dsRBD-like fold, HicA-like mRNA interferase family n=2 Tax=Lactobacillus bombicola TaxID=1505723 RepID=A0A1I1TPP1_9LACO|nr:type II toxin-antitoxin system HicA family toxin [Lactobacillus bombicola]SFD60537.1 Predicted RNA binding protein YcfA, dsRBD-like fold, HicA-like mRNA interferase family [Lactobacillus bombicola]
MPMKTKEFVRLLKRNGFVKVSQTGSHAKYRNGTRQVIVPIHARELPKGIEHSMMKQAGLR